MSTIKTDALIVGSGFGGAAPALRLAEAGLEVTVLEKGRHVDAPGDFRQTQDPSYYLDDHYRGLTGDNIGMTYIEGLGGGSSFYEMVSLRAPSMAFDLEDEYGRRVWPASVTRQALDPYYDVAEEMLKVRQISKKRIPKSGLVFARMMKNLGYSCDRASYAVRGCRGSGFCVAGCIYGAKQSLHFNYIPQAIAAGATYRTDVDVREIRAIDAPSSATDDLPPYRFEVRGRDTARGERARFHTRLLILAGGTVGSALLLLASRPYLPGLGPVGRRIAFNGGVKTAGVLGSEWPDGDMFTGRSHPGMISYEFLESDGITVQAAKPLPLQAIAAARLSVGGEGVGRFWGPEHLELMENYRHRVMVLAALGLTPPTARLELEDGKPRLRLEVTDEIRGYYDRTKEILHAIYLRNGCRPLDVDFIDSGGMPRGGIFFSTSHQVGSCPMSDSRSLGVVDASGEAHGLPGLYVTDGAAIPGSIAVSTSLTILANAERIAAGMVRRLRRGVPVVLNTEGAS